MRRSLSLLLVACAAAGFVGCGRGSATGAETSEHPAEVHGAPEESELSTVTLTEKAVQRLGIETVAVQRKAVQPTRTLGGELIVPPGRSVVVTAPVAGSLAAPAGGALPAPGTLLRREQEVLRLYPIGAPDNDLVQREAEARARFDAASSAATRAEQLLRDRAGSQKELERARADLAVAEAMLQTVRNQRRALGGATGGDDDDPGAWSMRSPLEGRLQRIHVAVGQTVTPAAPLFEVIADQPLWVRVPVYVGDVSSVDREQSATVQDIGASSSWNPLDAGTTPTRSATPLPAPPMADPRTATVDLLYRLDNRDGAYRPGQKVAVTLALASAKAGEESLVVPYASVLFDIHGGTWVYENPTPRQYVRRRVEIGRVVGDQVVLSRGPAPDALVVHVGVAELFGTEFGVGH